MDVAVIVAHPDDETIWSGGLILSRCDWQWHIFSLCRGDDPDRAPKFRSACKRLGAKCGISDLDDSQPLRPLEPERDIGRRLLEFLGHRQWDLCITHGPNGEYGHPRHKEVHCEVVRLAREAKIRCGGLWTFAYECCAMRGCCGPASWCDHRISLSEWQLAEKRRIITEIYGYAEDSFEAKVCISPECFRRHGVSAGGSKS